MEDSKQLLNNIKTRNKKIEDRLNKVNINVPYRGKKELDEIKKEKRNV